MKIGLITGFSPSHIIVRADSWEKTYRIPKLGTNITDAELNPIGTVYDIIGPVSKPFFVLKVPRSKPLSSLSSLVGEPVYTETGKTNHLIAKPKKTNKSSYNKSRCSYQSGRRVKSNDKDSNTSKRKSTDRSKQYRSDNYRSERGRSSSTKKNTR